MHDLVGCRLGRYETVRPIDASGMDDVYPARDRELVGAGTRKP